MSPAASISSPRKRQFLIGNGVYRLRRHLLFWFLYAAYFYLQGISPDCVKGLSRSDVFYYAFVSVCCFMPACIACVYATLYGLHPLFLQKKQYWRFAGGILVLWGLITVANYFFSILFFVFSCHCDPAGIPVVRKFALGFLNGQNAIIAAGLALGLKLAVKWYYQKKENLELSRWNTSTRLKALKAKVHPDYTLTLLNGLTDRIRLGASDARPMVLQLSDLLSYWLYVEEEQSISIGEEVAILAKFLSLEGAKRGLPPIADISVACNDPGALVTPMILLPLLQAACTEGEYPDGRPPSFRQIRLAHIGRCLYFRLQMDLPPVGDRSAVESSDLGQNAIDRLKFYYPHRHKLTITELAPDGPCGTKQLLLHLSLDIAITNTPGSLVAGTHSSLQPVNL